MFDPEQEVFAVLGSPGLRPSPGHEAGLQCPLWRITGHTHDEPTPLKARYVTRLVLNQRRLGSEPPRYD